MNCLRCGRETTNQQVFCDRCLKKMERYPVKPDARFYLPTRKPKAVPSKVRAKRELSPEEMVTTLQKRLRSLTIAYIVLLIVAVIAVVITYYSMRPAEVPNIGGNYQTVTTPATGASETTEFLIPGD